MASLYTNEQLPTTSEQAIREFQEKYLAVLTAAQPLDWASRFVLNVNAPRATFPISLMSTKFRETKEQTGTFKTMAEKSFDVKVVEFDAGYEAPAIDLVTNVFAYRNWSKVPQRFVLAEGHHICLQLATILEAGTSTVSPWDNVNFFSTSHKVNPAYSASTWSNYNAAGVDPASETNLVAEITSMMATPDENGDKLGVVPDEIWLPTDKFFKVSNYLNKAFIGNGETNAIAGKLRPVHVPELTDTNDWYLVDSKLIGQGFDPLVATVFRPSASLGLRIFDESSDYFKSTSKVKIGAHIWTGFGLVFPHAIRRVAGA